MGIFDPGLGRVYEHHTQRIINKDGSFNIKRKGVRKQRYQDLVTMSDKRFYGVIILTYLLANLIFAMVYLSVGIHKISVTPGVEELHGFWKALFFSMQTFTTVGFGSIFPNDPTANFVAGMEAMFGTLFFAISTGLVYGRFSKASARILFSNNALISPYKGGQALMFRIVNRRPNVLMEMEAKVMLAIDVDEGEGVERRYFNLKLEQSSVHFFPLSWTIIHPLDERSPLFGLSREEMRDKSAEILILIKGFDDTFSKHVHIRFSYIVDEFVYNARFLRNFHADESGEILLDIDGVHNFELID